MRIPLHLDPADQSPAAREARANLALGMAELKPGGFRTPGKRGGAGSLPALRMVEAGTTSVAELRADKSERRKRKERARAAGLAQCRQDAAATARLPDGTRLRGDAACKVLWQRRVEARRAQREEGRKP